MYLKSLALKGFKSFADRSVLALEPGITAIVGPNGSGKSNISDAVLWVLGERSARNLRGQAMEDIIFSGSAARKAVSVAEVDLVLDNSDHTLPVDFDEVVITRRMYRSGESEYLVNGVVARRLDVLDILHDTGLGTGTHSIISQGSLDSILQSKPEDRRALIEEAAGVLKHKQRKEKSARKLAAMDTHLNRVRDVAGEVSRQLGPLERKAKRAAAYKEASAQLADVKLALAVDELRSLQEAWDKICQAEATVSAEVEERKATVSLTEQKVSDFQEIMKRESEDATELSRQQRRASNLAERLDSAEMLLRERRRAAVAYEADMRTSLDNSTVQRKTAQAELSTAQLQLKEVEQTLNQVNQKIENIASEKAQIDAQLAQDLKALEESADQLRQFEEEGNEARKRRELLQESLANGLAHMKLVEARKTELSSDLSKAQDGEKEAARVLAEAKVELEDLEAKSQAAQQLLTQRFTEREDAQKAQDKARLEVSAVESEIKALQTAIRTFAEEDPALIWLLDHSEGIAGGITALSSALKVESSLEQLVESLLGEDLAALAVENEEAALCAIKALKDGSLSGDVSLLINSDAKNYSLQTPVSGKRLMDNITCPDNMKPAIEALLGDVIVCNNYQEAFEAHRIDASHGRFVSLDGCAIWPNGKVRFYGSGESADEGVLARQRRLDGAQEKLESCQRNLEAAETKTHQAEEAYREAQSSSLSLSQQVANQKGVCAAAQAEQERTSKRLASVISEIEDIENQVQTARKTVDELRPEMDACSKLIETLEDQKASVNSFREEKNQSIAPLRHKESKLTEELNDLRLSAAKADERKRYGQRIVEARTRDIETIDSEAKEARRQLVLKSVAVTRGQDLLGVFETLSRGLASKARLLEEALNASQSATSSVHADAASARDAARKAHDDYDAVSSRMAQVQVEKSRLEVQVEAAVHLVVHECETPLEVAEQLPRLEDKNSLEDERFRLERKIKNMGTINPDAAEEYATLKERYDFLMGQLEDMEAARRSLNRITRVIDSRMKDDFVQTFEKVNNNFNEIFSLLFPGGSAHLSLEDPEDIENSGVEVTAQPRGKRLTKMMLMSGGEKSLTALALLFAVYKTRATPFYILDEVEAALDDTNLRRLTSYIDTLRNTTQLIMITHQRRTMEMADVLFGVSMQADGVTHVISQKLERALEHAHEE